MATTRAMRSADECEGIHSGKPDLLCLYGASNQMFLSCSSELVASEH